MYPTLEVDGWHPIHYAVWCNDVSAAAGLLAHDPGTVLTLRTSDSMSSTALHLSAGLGLLSMTQLLLEHGADPSLLNGDQQTPLVLCQTLQHGPEWESVVELLQY